ncbi:hypothetical protein A9267_17645 [Shewanella sp. UCD-FRSSP16_17]|uniref:hypothetical protein n=1 Tax=Shewanella sp. UCD-FRSSP16_17 TaxID=1853256 RepID=UPI0007EEDC2E|nr:hypothetical protein [Shewanella sp. UCD-FRSSP16_17]OBT04764.1 hypothetical protein A9267_17645 [Shewanella sp. UCD-FRSSP16_17]
MKTKPLQPRLPIDWLEYSYIFKNLMDKSNVNEENIKVLNAKIDKLQSLSQEDKKYLRKMTKADFKKHLKISSERECVKVVCELNLLGIEFFGSIWKKFGSNISSAKHSKSSYPLNLSSNERFELEELVESIYVKNKKEIEREMYGYLNEKGVENIEDYFEEFEEWLEDLITDDPSARYGKNLKHKFDKLIFTIIVLSLKKDLTY